MWVGDDRSTDRRIVFVQGTIQDELGESHRIGQYVLHIEIEVETPAGKKPLFIYPDIQSIDHIRSQGIDAGIIRNGPSVDIPVLGQVRVFGEGREGQPGLETPVDTGLPIFAKSFTQG